jgi:hypothetical protein
MAGPRICPHCGTANSTQATFCGACATQMVSTSRALVPVQRKSALPVLSQRDKATLGGVALGVAALAVRVGAALLKQAATESRQEAPISPAPAPAAPSNSIHIRRRWVVGDTTGPVRWGEEEIEIDRPADDTTNYRVWFGRPK